MEKELAIRILNFVSPYIPEHIREDAMDIINKETMERKNIKDPSKHNYARTTIRWKDSGDMEDVIFKLSNDVVDGEDDLIFFYCESEEEYKKLLNHDNGEDFEIVGCTLYMEEL